MRNLLWRGLAVALAGGLSWLLWHWPEPAPPVEPIELTLDLNCENGPLTLSEAEFCADVKAHGGMSKAQRLVAGSRCIHGTLVKKIDGEWRNIGWCPPT